MLLCWLEAIISFRPGGIKDKTLVSPNQHVMGSELPPKDLRRIVFGKWISEELARQVAPRSALIPRIRILNRIFNIFCILDPRLIFRKKDHSVEVHFHKTRHASATVSARHLTDTLLIRTTMPNNKRLWNFFVNPENGPQKYFTRLNLFHKTGPTFFK